MPEKVSKDLPKPTIDNEADSPQDPGTDSLIALGGWSRRTTLLLTLTILLANWKWIQAKVQWNRFLLLPQLECVPLLYGTRLTT